MWLRLFVLLTLAACGPKERLISGPLQLGPEWTEIRPDPPLESSRVRQIVSISIPFGLDVSDYSLTTTDGKPLKVEVEVIDDRGETWPHSLHMRGAPWVGFGVVTERMPKEIPVPYYLPPDRTYPVVRIRSNPPVAAQGVRWVCSSPK